MKKLKLSLQNMEGVEVLSRERLKKVLGGSGQTPCTTTMDCSNGQVCGTPWPGGPYQGYCYTPGDTGDGSGSGSGSGSETACGGVYYGYCTAGGPCLKNASGFYFCG